MLGFMKKDLLMIKSNLKLFALLFFVYGIMAFQGEFDLSFILPFMSVMIMITTFSYDTYNHWDAYAVTLPNGRRKSALAKYAVTVILIVITTVIISILSIAIAYTRTQTVNFENLFSTILGNIFATTFLQSLMYPAIYKFGVEKARIGIFIVVFGIAIVGGVLAKFLDFGPFFQMLDGLDVYWFVILPIIILLMLFVSFMISERIYQKKEF